MRLTKLEMRRERGDLIQFYKGINGLDHIEWENELTTIRRGMELRNEGICYQRENAKISTVRDKFFINRVVPLWNNLPQKVKEAKTLNSFKAGLDGLEYFSI